MREILFRGKCKKSGEWLYGDFLSATTDGIPWILPANVGEEIKVDPGTVGQYTGVNDKNGKRIFEGDIVRHYNENPYAIPDIIEKGEVYWDEQYCGWRRTSNGAFHHGIVDTYRMAHDCVYEIIGNIHDNPELLEEVDNHA